MITIYYYEVQQISGLETSTSDEGTRHTAFFTSFSLVIKYTEMYSKQKNKK